MSAVIWFLIGAAVVVLGLAGFLLCYFLNNPLIR